MTNLVLIDCHDLGRHLGCYGQTTVNSPNLDGLAAAGLRFTNSFCTAPQCSPSRSALYTGRYPHSNGMLGLAHSPFSWRLHPDEVYLARYFQMAGFETVLIGGQHVTSGRDDAVGQLGFDHVHSSQRAHDVAAHATAFLERAHDRPFFLNIGFFEPHRDDHGQFKQAPPDTERGVAVPPYLPDTPEARAEVADLQGAIRLLDSAVGEIVSALRKTGLMADTWLIFTTDHGLAMPRAKCTMYDPGIVTALIMLAEPFGLTGGRVVDALTSHVDLTPTILDAFGLRSDRPLQGRSYWPLLQQHPFSPRSHVFAEKTFHTDYEPQRAVRTDRYKLIANLEVDIINVPGDIQHSPIYPQMIDELTVERPPIELYDLAVDPLERTNVAEDAAYESIRHELIDVLYAWMQETEDPILRGPISSPYYDRALSLLRRERA